jgi:hypothetical protein
MSRLGTIAAGVGVSTTIQLTYLPQFLTFIIPTTPTSIRVNVLGDGVTMDLDAAGVDQLNGYETFGLFTNQFTIPLADGLVKGKNVEITIVNADAAGFDIFGYSKLPGKNYFVYQRQTILANSGVDFINFGLLAITAPGVTDIFNITYRSGIVEANATLNEIRADVSYFQNNVGVFLINNLDQIVRTVNIIPAANRVAYLMKFEPVGDIDNAPITKSN